MLDANPLRRMCPAFGLVRRRNGGEDRPLVLRGPRGVSTAPAGCALTAVVRQLVG